jgi:hypothetical protein
VALGLVVAGIFGPLGGKQDLTTDPTAFLPANAQSTQVVVLQKHLPSACGMGWSLSAGCCQPRP